MSKAVVMVICGALWPGQAQGAEARAPLVQDSALQSAGLMAYWRAQLPLSAGDELRAAHLVDDTVYAATKKGTLFALTAETGLIRWGAKLTVEQFVIHPPTHILARPDTAPVVVATSNEFYLLDRHRGTEIQRLVPAFPIGGPVAAAENVVYAGSPDGHVRALQLRYQHGQPPFVRWVVTAQGSVTTSPVFQDVNTLIVASQGGYVFSCRTIDKALNWAYRTGDKITAEPAVDATGIYVASHDRSLYKLNPATGRPVWRVRTPEPLRTSPVVLGNTVYQFCEHRGLAAYDAGTGRELWLHAGAVSLVARTESGVALMTPAGHIEFVDATTGDVLRTLVSDTVSGAVTNTRSDSIYVFGLDGRLMCLRPDDTPYLRRQQILAAKRLLQKPDAKQAGTSRADAGPADATSAATDPFKSRNDRP